VGGGGPTAEVHKIPLFALSACYQVHEYRRLQYNTPDESLPVCLLSSLAIDASTQRLEGTHSTRIKHTRGTSLPVPQRYKPEGEQHVIHGG